MVLSLSVVSVEEFLSMALYRQFIVGMMALYALAMTVLTVIFAVNGNVAAVLTLAVALVVWVVALSIVPARFGAIEAAE
jgi:hypothetical protein